MEYMMNTKKLRDDICKALDNWDERSLFSVAGCKGLTRSDIDTLLMCCDWHDKHGSLDGLAYFGPNIARVLAEYGGNVDRRAFLYW